jgi:hypothetical protein
MTEPHPDADLEAAPQVAWPELPPAGFDESGSVAHSGNADPDATVQAILGRVRDIPTIPVSEHPAAYAEMHDSLLAALNEDISGPDASAGPGGA